jgi:hypothetical protein
VADQLLLGCLGGTLITISVAFSLVMAARELGLAKDDLPARIEIYDVFVLMPFFVAAVAAGVLAI